MIRANGFEKKGDEEMFPSVGMECIKAVSSSRSASNMRSLSSLRQRSTSKVVHVQNI